MPAKPKPTADPTVLSLINDKIDTLQDNLTRTITDGNTHLGGRIDSLETTVLKQNGRIGRVEIAHTTCQTERRTEVRLSNRQRAALFGGGGVSGAAILALLKWVVARAHEAGLLG